MNRLPLFCAALLAATSVSAQVMRGPSSWSVGVPAVQSAAISNFLQSPAADVVAYPGLVAGLRGSLSAAGSPALAPVADALAAQGVAYTAVPTAAQFEYALVAAARAVQTGAISLLKAQPLETAAEWDSRAEGLSRYAAGYGLYMAPHELSELRQKADAAKVYAARLRGEGAVASAERDADALGRGRGPQEVPAGESASGSVLTPSKPRDASAEKPAPPAPSAPAPKKEALVNAAVYVGGGIVITAMALFLGTTWATIGTGAALAASLAYLASFWAGASVLRKKGFAVASGVLATLSVAMAPVAVAAGLSLAGASFDTYAVRLAVEASAVVGAVLAARRFRFGFLAMPAALALLGMSVDVVGQLLPHAHSWGTSALFATLGAALVAGGRALDVRFKGVDYARWVYLAGLTALVFGAGMLAWNYLVLPKLVFALGGAALIAIGALIDRKSFAVYGAGALFSYLGYLLWDVFGGSLFSYFGMAGFGVGVIVLAVLYQKNAAAIGAYLRGLLRGRGA